MARITIIEDEAELGSLIAGLLTAKGHTVRHTRDAKSGVHHCEDGSTDILITDLNVPHSDALDKLLPPTGPAGLSVIVISGSLDSPSHSARAEQLAGLNVIAKPFRLSELLRKVEVVAAEHDGTAQATAAAAGA